MSVKIALTSIGEQLVTETRPVFVPLLSWEMWSRGSMMESPKMMLLIIQLQPQVQEPLEKEILAWTRPQVVVMFSVLILRHRFVFFLFLSWSSRLEPGSFLLLDCLVWDEDDEDVVLTGAVRFNRIDSGCFVWEYLDRSRVSCRSGFGGLTGILGRWTVSMEGFILSRRRLIASACFLR